MATYAAGPRLAVPQRSRRRRRVHHRRLVPLLPRQPLGRRGASRSPAGGQPVGRPRPGVVRHVAAGPPQLRPSCPRSAPSGRSGTTTTPTPYAMAHNEQRQRQARTARRRRTGPTANPSSGRVVAMRIEALFLIGIGRLLRRRRRRLLVLVLRARRDHDAGRHTPARPAPRQLLPVVVAPDEATPRGPHRRRRSRRGPA